MLCQLEVMERVVGDGFTTIQEDYSPGEKNRRFTEQEEGVLKEKVLFLRQELLRLEKEIDKFSSKKVKLP